MKFRFLVSIILSISKFSFCNINESLVINRYQINEKIDSLGNSHSQFFRDDNFIPSIMIQNNESVAKIDKEELKIKLNSR